MAVIDSRYQTPSLLANGHLQTIYPYFFRKVVEVPFQRKRIITRDKDFLDVDYTDAGSDELVILCHGLEGSSNTGYIRGMTKFFTETQNLDIMAVNYRSCSGEINHFPQFYHAASINDLDDIILFAKSLKRYKKINLIGFSLGGNLVSFYLAKMGRRQHSEIHRAVVFSSPIHLESSILKIQSTKIGKFYSESFLKTMRQKVMQKSKVMDLSGINISKIKNAKDFLTFDNEYTAPVHGFKNAVDYYNQASAYYCLDEVDTPILFVQAKDDPFLTKKCFPIRQAWRSPFINLEITPTGGHVGFMNFNSAVKYWSEVRAAEFILGEEAILNLKSA